MWWLLIFWRLTVAKFLFLNLPTKQIGQSSESNAEVGGCFQRTIYLLLLMMPLHSVGRQLSVLLSFFCQMKQFYTGDSCPDSYVSDPQFSLPSNVVISEYLTVQRWRQRGDETAGPDDATASLKIGNKV